MTDWNPGDGEWSGSQAGSGLLEWLCLLLLAGLFLDRDDPLAGMAGVVVGLGLMAMILAVLAVLVDLLL